MKKSHRILNKSDKVIKSVNNKSIASLQVNIKMKTSDWPPSNYPIFLALVLLFATAVTLAMGDEPLAEDLAIYAYYLLVIGVTIRFFELALPDDTPQKIDHIKYRIRVLHGKFSNFINEHIPRNITSTIPERTLKSVNELILTIISKLNFYIKTSYIVHISDISKNVTIYLSVVFVIMLVYGFIFDWWNVKGYLRELALIIIGFFTLYMISIIFIRKSNLN